MAKRLTLDASDERHSALTPPVAGFYKEAAAVCLSRHHTPPVTIKMMKKTKMTTDNKIGSATRVATGIRARA